MEEANKPESFSADRLRLEILAGIHLAPRDVGPCLYRTDNDCGIWEDQEEDFHDLFQHFTAQNGVGLRIKVAGQSGGRKSGHAPGRLGGGKLVARNGSTSMILQNIMERLQLDEVRYRVHAGQNSQAYHAINHDKSASYFIKIFTNAKRRQLMVRAQREFDLLSRAFNSQVRVPEPVMCQEHILVTRFVGNDQNPVPSLVNTKGLCLAISYIRVLASIRWLYWAARLVHGNVSEHTMLYDRYKYWLTDFGHAVDRDHPDHKELLKKDVARINEFFSMHGLQKATRNTLGLLPDDKAMAVVTLDKDPRYHFCDEYHKCGEYVSIYAAAYMH